MSKLRFFLHLMIQPVYQFDFYTCGCLEQNGLERNDIIILKSFKLWDPLFYPFRGELNYKGYLLSLRQLS